MKQWISQLEIEVGQLNSKAQFRIVYFNGSFTEIFSHKMRFLTTLLVKHWNFNLFSVCGTNYKISVCEIAANVKLFLYQLMLKRVVLILSIAEAFNCVHVIKIRLLLHFFFLFSSQDNNHSIRRTQRNRKTFLIHLAVT